MAHSGAIDNTPQQRAFTPTALDHVSVTTSDLPGTAAKWATALGLSPVDASEHDGARIAKIPAHNAYIALTHPLSSDGAIAAAMAERGQGMHAVAIAVDDIDEAVRDLRLKGVEISDPAPGREPGTRVASIAKASANGVPVVLVQRS